MLCLKLWKIVKEFFRHYFILISSKCRQLQGSSSDSLMPLDRTGASSQTMYRLALPRLLKFLQVILNLLDPFRSSSTTISAPLRKTSIATSRSFSSTASDVCDKLPVHVSSASTLPVFRRQAPFLAFIPSCLLWMHYTDHRSRNLLQYHVVYLARSSPASTIS